MHYDLDIKSEGIILERRPEYEFENQAVLNPTCVEFNNVIHMFYRAVRKDFVSTVGYCQLQDNKVIYRASHPVLFPEYAYEKFGAEDPRLVYFDGLFYMFYVAYDGENAQVAYATSTDLVNFTKHGLISAQLAYSEAKKLFPANSPAAERLANFRHHYRFGADPNSLLWEKDAFLFPEKINDRFAMLVRILPGIQVIYFDDFSELTNDCFWKNYLKNLDKYVIMQPEFRFENKHIGAGAPPMLTKEGWLLIYHAVEVTSNRTIYRACAALLDRKNPTHVIGRLKEPLFGPEESWELIGDVDNVVFPTGLIQDGDRLMIYYGAADRLIAAKSLSMKKLLRALTSS